LNYFDGLAVVNVAHLLISALNITMSQRKSVLYVSNITSTVSGVSLGKFIGIKYRAWYLPLFSSNLAQHRVVDTLHHACQHSHDEEIILCSPSP
jgi:hypothetical protein